MSTPVLSPRPREASSRVSRPTLKTRTSNTRSPTAAHSHHLLSPRRMNDAMATTNVNSTTTTTATKDPRTPSPNYFGLQFDANADVFSSSAAQHIRGNWSPPSSNVRSTAAASPHVIPVDQNPEFEQFRRQSENNKSFRLGSFDFAAAPSPSVVPKGSVFGPLKTPLSPTSMVTTSSPNGSSGSSKDVKDDSSDQNSGKPRSPKRLLSSESSLFPERRRRNSPASFLDQEGFGRTDELAEFIEDRHPRPSLPPRGSAHHASTLANHRADTLPNKFEDDVSSNDPIMVTSQHVVNILESSPDEVLLLDLRVSTQYARARLIDALSLCIPTTLLKRASFNVQKLAETFKDEDQREKFESWRRSKYIIVYDANSSQMKDAATCINTLKKFTSEGWTGASYIVRGGFSEFSESFPSWITNGSASSSPTSATAALSIDSDGPAVAPVIGGCPMPATQNAANPFFGNIRQNMDLIGGVGQMPIKHPASMTDQMNQQLPQWLHDTSAIKDQGKLVSDRFLQIEKREQKRMQEALSGKVVYEQPGTATEDTTNIQIAGIEKGSKNRYNNIWPYEHTRVKLQGVSDGGCDYINANHIQAAWSNKRYIATQGPIPATFKDFWNVVWQQDVRVIVMLTAEQEGGQVKAHNYWSERQHGHLHLSPLGERKASLEPSRIHRHREHLRPQLGQRRSTNPPRPQNLQKETRESTPGSEQPYVIVRKFTLSNSDEPFARMREITQLQYSSWPDFGAPAHPAHLLGLIEQCDAVVRQVNGGSATRPDPPNGRPVLVHCSAGCGRTGTFCTVDSVIDMLKRQRQSRNARHTTPMEVDASLSQAENSAASKDDKANGSWITKDDIDLVAKTVEDFRLQRLSMVQSLRQFVLCYESVLEWLVEQQPRSA